MSQTLAADGDADADGGSPLGFAGFWLESLATLALPVVTAGSGRLGAGTVDGAAWPEDACDGSGSSPSAMLAEAKSTDAR